MIYKARRLAVFSILFVLSLFLFPPLISPTHAASSFADPQVFKSNLIDCEVFFSNCNNLFNVPLNLEVTGMEIDVVNNSGSAYAVSGSSAFGYPFTCLPDGSVCSLQYLASAVETPPSLLVGTSSFHFYPTPFLTSSIEGKIVASIYTFSKPSSTKFRLTLYGKTVQ